jgi:hypothetical protein
VHSGLPLYRISLFVEDKNRFCTDTFDGAKRILTVLHDLDEHRSNNLDMKAVPRLLQLIRVFQSCAPVCKASEMHRYKWEGV